MAIIKQSKYEVLPMGEYSAVIVDAEMTKGDYGLQVAFTFIIEGGPHDGVSLKHWTSAKFSPKSNLYKLAKAAFGGKPIPETYDLSTDDLIGRKLNLMVIIRVKADDPSAEINKVDDVRPLRQASGNGQQEPPPPPANDWPGGEQDEIPF